MLDSQEAPLDLINVRYCEIIVFNINCKGRHLSFVSCYNSEKERLKKTKKKGKHVFLFSTKKLLLVRIWFRTSDFSDSKNIIFNLILSFSLLLILFSIIYNTEYKTKVFSLSLSV